MKNLLFAEAAVLAAKLSRTERASYSLIQAEDEDHFDIVPGETGNLIYIHGALHRLGPDTDNKFMATKLRTIKPAKAAGKSPKAAAPAPAKAAPKPEVKPKAAAPAKAEPAAKEPKAPKAAATAKVGALPPLSIVRFVKEKPRTIQAITDMLKGDGNKNEVTIRVQIGRIKNHPNLKVSDKGLVSYQN
jgi:hypothetical protein